MKWFYRAAACCCFCLFMIGVGSFDSEDLGIPVIITIAGLFGTYIFGRWGYEKD